eukprot:TRINITY_DN20935_c0_g1_i6.p1 TRINITY_DN20935_c0_g1~~TRINITY_DN20935_c0_g1_i6.p1  ORF type:complete len:284 (-),score=-15.09 TRINITY_DN20935_c0_g1_i6:254-1105(-)
MKFIQTDLLAIKLPILKPTIKNTLISTQLIQELINYHFKYYIYSAVIQMVQCLEFENFGLRHQTIIFKFKIFKEECQTQQQATKQCSDCLVCFQVCKHRTRTKFKYLCASKLKFNNPKSHFSVINPTQSDANKFCEYLTFYKANHQNRIAIKKLTRINIKNDNFGTQKTQQHTFPVLIQIYKKPQGANRDCMYADAIAFTAFLKTVQFRQHLRNSFVIQKGITSRQQQDQKQIQFGNFLFNRKERECVPYDNMYKTSNLSFINKHKDIMLSIEINQHFKTMLV